jgi:hypothetical protein
VPDVAGAPREDLPVPGLVARHLQGQDVARVVYGSVVGLALVVALETHPPRPGTIVASIVGAAVAVGLAELYSDILAAELRNRRRVDANTVRMHARSALVVALAAGFPAVFFVLATAGVLETGNAFKLAKWTGLGLLGGYAFFAARLTGARVPRALLHAACVAAAGTVLVLLKALATH